MNKKRIGILTGGGDCAGLNPAIKWVVKTATDEAIIRKTGIEFETYGIRDGWRGLVEADTRVGANLERFVVPLNQSIVRTWDREGGTRLGTSRTNPYNPKNNTSRIVLENIERLGLDYIVAIGGEDTLGVAHKLYNDGVSTVGIPKTIDNDLSATDYSLGFETAVNVIAEEVGRLRTTAGSHSRVFVVETMGRHAGWLALEGGRASGAFIILIPEYDFSTDKIIHLLKSRKTEDARYSIVIVSEGAKVKGKKEVTIHGKKDSFGHKALGGVGEFLATELRRGTGYETRYVVLSHLQRGGSPSAYDVRMGRDFGIAAVDLIVNGMFGRMVSFKDGRVTHVPLAEAVKSLKTVDVKTLYDTERYNARRFGIIVPVAVARPAAAKAAPSSKKKAKTPSKKKTLSKKTTPKKK